MQNYDFIALERAEGRPGRFRRLRVGVEGRRPPVSLGARPSPHLRRRQCSAFSPPSAGSALRTVPVLGARLRPTGPLGNTGSGARPPHLPPFPPSRSRPFHPQPSTVPGSKGESADLFGGIWKVLCLFHMNQPHCEVPKTLNVNSSPKSHLSGISSEVSNLTQHVVRMRRG